jgi:phage N-6-adenine-methyltransferase
MINLDVHYSSKSIEYETPHWLFDELNGLFCFTLDVAASHDNFKTQKYYTKEDDGLAQDWTGEIVWCNPPYGREITKFAQKFVEQKNKAECIVALIPARTQTIWMQNYVFPHASFICFIKRKLKFHNMQHDAPFPSCLAVYFNDNSGVIADGEIDYIQAQMITYGYVTNMFLS